MIEYSQKLINIRLRVRMEPSDSRRGILRHTYVRKLEGNWKGNSIEAQNRTKNLF